MWDRSYLLFACAAGSQSIHLTFIIDPVSPWGLWTGADSHATTSPFCTAQKTAAHLLRPTAFEDRSQLRHELKKPPTIRRLFQLQHILRSGCAQNALYHIVIHQNATAMFANDDLLVAANIQLTLRGDRVEATAAASAFDGNDR